jgi:crotonobetainyl-CoA:carnitine CoA-transferase CaiB-like acyl-CoA transferase
MTIAGAISAALLRRERTGKPSVVDISLLGVAMWILSPDIVASKLVQGSSMPAFSRRSLPNPIVNTYKTSDGRFISLVMLESDRYWPNFCRLIGHPELTDDPRFVDAAARFENREECIAIIDGVFATKTFEQWREILKDAEGVWAPVQKARELHDDPQAIANGYLREVVSAEGTPFTLVANPVQFDEAPADLRPGPDHGQHTEEVLLELGLDWSEIIAHKESGAIL